MQISLKRKPAASFGPYLAILIICMAILLVSILIGPQRYYQRILLLVLLWASASSAFNIMSGYGGQVVFGYMLFEGIGAYTTVLLFKFLGVSPWFGMWAGVLLAVAAAFVIGLPTLKLHGAYFAVATVAFPLIVAPVLNYIGLEEVSIPFSGHGPASLQFRDMRSYVYIGVVLLGAILLVVQTVVNSRFGFFLRAVKQNEAASEGLGIDTFRVKLSAFMLSAGLGAIVGTIYAFSILMVLTTTSIFGIFIIVRILSITIVGGLATVWGPLLAASLLVPAGEILNAAIGSKYPGVQDIVYGAAIVVTIIYLPTGIWPSLRNVFYRWIKKDKPVLAKGLLSNTASMEECNTDLRRSEAAHRGLGDHLLRVESVKKSFGGVKPLVDVSFDVPEGGILGIIGPNGAGKTTLFNVVNGYLKPDGGKIFFKGQEIGGAKPHLLCRLGMARTFQIPQILMDMSVLDNILVGAFVRETSGAKARSRAEDIAKQMGISGRLQDKAVGLTIWETKVIEIGRACATCPELLLLDEPMAGLNPEEAGRIGAIIKNIAEGGTTVIIIEHLIRNLVQIADRMIGLDEGRIIAQGKPQEVISDPHIIEAYLGTKWRERYAQSS